MAAACLHTGKRATSLKRPPASANRPDGRNQFSRTKVETSNTPGGGPCAWTQTSAGARETALQAVSSISLAQCAARGRSTWTRPLSGSGIGSSHAQRRTGASSESDESSPSAGMPQVQPHSQVPAWQQQQRRSCGALSPAGAGSSTKAATCDARYTTTVGHEYTVRDSSAGQTLRQIASRGLSAVSAKRCLAVLRTSRAIARRRPPFRRPEKCARNSARR
jgi:hypothetical protein